MFNITINIWLEHELDESLEAKAHVLVTLMKDSANGLEFDFADEFMPEFEDELNPEYFQLWIDHNEVFERSHSLKNSNLPYEFTKEEGVKINDIILKDGRKGRMIQVNFYPQIPNDKNRTPESLSKQKLVTLVLASEREELDLLIKIIGIITIVSTVIVLFLVNYLVRLYVKKGLNPLHDLKDQLKLLDAKNLNERLTADNLPNELFEVIDQFNDLLIRLDKSFYREQRFSADIAHELRTPIAELRSMSEVALKWPHDISLVEEFYTSVYESSIQMQALVNNLLALTRCEKGDLILEKLEINLKNLIMESWSCYMDEAEIKKNELSINVLSELTLFTCKAEFKQIINNLLSNAVSYGAENSAITIKATVFKNNVDLIVSNYAYDLDQSDLDYMYDRLWRKSKSRTSTQHSGLGLSLVKAYVNILGLEISTELSENKLFSIKISGLHKGRSLNNLYH